jgi:hypothetical protein
MLTSNTSLSFSTTTSAFHNALSMDALRERAPAVFASGAHESLSPRYTFIPTERVLSGLMSAGFMPVEARQTRSPMGMLQYRTNSGERRKPALGAFGELTVEQALTCPVIFGPY